ncbi:probable 28S ribosomal protein S16, mitochondrial [Mercenaria mercenaria]|uniref:probable 28S ribosomal protein S16, mitochondrial n=1 Tax=Mercenaria mercenaria TaxID=6596 RepID=UPI001E1E0511|nr:probable 28S ribosomal protein S16, mitochondrial [Mercenaria mercenaria]XP_045215984.1 probable 28S ribosomal protein S16, mitochondrial [Mercenaria mercenaria]XP_045215985.1 probable 28S ribosomal protein S16, mitochondrial [Mercenaria mercenaria]XP_045215986.1 probable 28S ribosomal protein S16, mitochondrial [Mercenaria mercenaria]XP_045215987.1 probable 28S ribosomal protein S16, mitochondrial [Mercenaria mercenaria]
MASKIDRSTRMMIRLSRRGCTNRPFYHIVVMRNRQPRDKKVTDQLGTFDPLPNIHNEKLVAIDFEKLRRWLEKGAICSQPVEVLLGYAGFFPVHPRTRLSSFRKQRKLEEQNAINQTEVEGKTEESKIS